MPNFRNSRKTLHNYPAKWYWPRRLLFHDPDKAGPGIAFPEQSEKVKGWRRWGGTDNDKRKKRLIKEARRGNRRAINILAEKYGIRYLRLA